ncbi:MAG: Threonylcarbamoyladenosine tRNA methylthiotransferase MtaB [Firmicutes bacterium ADurb.Bin193]|nr:MAG: Threonylcarbamoyladenosine tRNA methylthiotransferase MtaB [Firmicutes bacterium ADurb.Bin193]
MKTVRFYTLGCKVNAYETEAMRSLFEKRGYTLTEADTADVYVINTCTVTSMGGRKSRGMISRARRSNPNAVIAVVGCYPQVFPDEVRKMMDVDIILGTTDRAKIVDLVEEFCGSRIDAIREKPDSFYENITSDGQSRTRAIMKIQDGCENFCSYCIIPYARGPIRSRPIEDIKEEAEALSKSGFTEVVLVGIHLSSYGRDIGLSLTDAISEVCKTEGIKRVRLGSLEPGILTDKFLREISSFDKLCPSFHISMQSGCDETLKRMNRKYTSDEYLNAVGRLKETFEGCAVTTDVMVGFPQESDEEFEKSCETVRKAGFAGIHVFKYSKRKGTVAAKMEGQIDPAVKAKRSQIMIDIGESLKKQYCNALIGKTEEVLFEDKSGECFEGLTKTHIKVRCKGDDLYGKYKSSIITEYKDGCLYGEIGGADAD